MPIDQDWLLLQQGNQQAFERIYREHIEVLYAYGMKFANDTGLVEDCVQDLFIGLWEKRDNLGDTDNIRAYLFVSIRRRIIKELKKKKNISNIDESNTFTAELAIDSIMEVAELNLEQAEKLKLAFQQLNKNQQHIIYLKYYQGFNSDEIAEMLKINNQSVRNKLSRAMTKLKHCFHVWLTLLIIYNWSI